MHFIPFTSSISSWNMPVNKVMFEDLSSRLFKQQLSNHAQCKDWWRRAVKHWWDSAVAPLILSLITIRIFWCASDECNFTNTPLKKHWSHFNGFCFNFWRNLISRILFEAVFPTAMPLFVTWCNNSSPLLLYAPPPFSDRLLSNTDLRAAFITSDTEHWKWIMSVRCLCSIVFNLPRW